MKVLAISGCEICGSLFSPTLAGGVGATPACSGRGGVHSFSKSFYIHASEDAPQPRPQEGQASANARLIDLLQQRDQLGISKYGRTLESFNGRDFVLDLREELLDALQYTEGWLAEREELRRLLREAAFLLIMARDRTVGTGLSWVGTEIGTFLKSIPAAVGRALKLP